MLNVGDRIETHDGVISGELVHLEDSIAYVELDTGVEMEYDISDLQIEGTKEAREKEEEKTAQNKQLGRTESNEFYGKVFAALPEVIKTAGFNYHSNLNKLFVSTSSTKSYKESQWGDTDNWQKLNIISVLLGITTEKLVAAYKADKSFTHLELVFYANLGHDFDQSNKE